MDLERRLDPDALLERVQQEEPSRGLFKIYLGMAAGVGKTYAMLTDALIEKQRGVDIVAGYIEPHGRVETESLAQQLERLPISSVPHRGLLLNEFNLEAALKRHPKVLLIDELAHTNAPGARHAKRWQDVEECLSNGISVWSTVNVQHVESLSDVVQKITGIQVSEIVPDGVIRKADEVEVIDVTPQELTQRIREGKVYLRHKAETALSHFFRPGNLIALREMVLRLTADRVDEQLSTFRRQHEVREVWPARPRILACVSPNFLSERVVRSAARLANSLQTELVAVSIDRLMAGGGLNEQKDDILTSLALAERLGARVVRSSSSDVVAEILRIAREQNATILVVGKPVRSRMREYLYGSVVDELIRRSGDLDVYVITDRARDSFIPLLLGSPRVSRLGASKAFLLVAITTIVCGALEPLLDISNLVMVYILSVAWAAARWGRGESIVVAILGVLAFDYFFVPPRWTFAVADFQYLVTFLVMLIIGLLISTLTTRLRNQADLVSHRERRTAALYELSKMLASATSQEQIASIVSDQAQKIFSLEAVLFLPRGDEILTVLKRSGSGFEREPNEIAVAQWVSRQGSAAGAGTMTLAGAQGYYVPLAVVDGRSSVLALPRGRAVWDAEQNSIFEAFVHQVTSALERLLAEDAATKREVEVERERVRNVLLSSVSHDFRTPLTAISGAADTLLTRFPPEQPQGLELLNSIRTEADALTRMVRNVLDLTKIESGEMKLNLEWESLEEVVGAALQRTRGLLGDRRVFVHLDPNVPLLKVDAGLLLQVFVNLFENVARHAVGASVLTISGKLNAETVQIRVSDNGRGLPEGTEKRVFDKSFRGTGDSEGFGLGLTICAAVMHAHGGDISARNKEEGGAEFLLTLPIPREVPELDHGK